MLILPRTGKVTGGLEATQRAYASPGPPTCTKGTPGRFPEPPWPSRNSLGSGFGALGLTFTRMGSFLTHAEGHPETGVDLFRDVGVVQQELLRVLLPLSEA